MSTNECYLVVVGKRGCGKSTVCNKLLTGRADGPFTVYRGMGASTEKFEDKHDDFEDAAVDVVDSPDVFNMGYTDHDAKSKFEEWRDRAPSDNKKTVFVFVVRMDLRFTPDDVKLYDKYIDLLPHELTDNTILAFTYTDELQEQLLDEIKLSPVKNLYKSLGERYVAFSKTDSSQQREENRTKIIQMIDRARRPATISSSSTEYRFVVVGKRGSGKSTVCNKLLTGRADGPFPDGETEKFQCHTKTRQNDTVHCRLNFHMGGIWSRVFGAYFANHQHEAETQTDAEQTTSVLRRGRGDITSVVQNELRIVLFGKTGSGKSATGNTILGEKRFEEYFGQGSGTTNCKIQATSINGRNIKIIDTPGVCDTYREKDEVLFEVSKSLLFSLPGPHALLFVINADARFTEEEYGAYQQLRKLFAMHLIKYIIVVFTRCDKFFQDGQSPEQAQNEIEKMFQRCKELSEKARREQRNVADVNAVLRDTSLRYVLFPNTLSLNTKDGQVSELLAMIDNMISENHEPFFHDARTEAATKLTEKNIREIMSEENVTQQEAWKILQQRIMHEAFQKRVSRFTVAGGLIAGVGATVFTGGLAAPLLAGAAGAAGGARAAGQQCSVM